MVAGLSGVRNANLPYARVGQTLGPLTTARLRKSRITSAYVISSLDGFSMRFIDENLPGEWMSAAIPNDAHSLLERMLRCGLVGNP